MNWNYFLIGVGFLLVAGLIYKGTKGKRTSEENNWKGLNGRTYVQGWGTMILCILVGIVFILKSLPSQI